MRALPVPRIVKRVAGLVPVIQRDRMLRLREKQPAFGKYGDDLAR